MHPRTYKSGSTPGTSPHPRWKEQLNRAAVTEDAIALARRVARLNPDAGEIGEGMLRTLQAEATQVVEQWEAREG